MRQAADNLVRSRQARVEPNDTSNPQVATRALIAGEFANDDIPSTGGPSRLLGAAASPRHPSRMLECHLEKGAAIIDRSMNHRAGATDSIPLNSQSIHSARSGTLVSVMKNICFIIIKSLTAVFLFMLLCRQSCASCLDWMWLATSNSNQLIYQGTVGGKPVRALLRLYEKTGHLDGVLGYGDETTSMTLTGHMLPKSVGTYLGADLEARNRAGRSIAHLNLTFLPWRQPWQSDAVYQNESKDTCEFLVGKWYLSKENKELEVKLRMDGSMAPQNNAEREANEKTAFLLRKAMLKGDRLEFTKLLKYPFESQHGNQEVNIWKTPEQVMAHYSDIVKFTRQQILISVPYALQTSRAGSQYMQGHIQLANGLVTKICEETCSVAP